MPKVPIVLQAFGLMDCLYYVEVGSGNVLSLTYSIPKKISVFEPIRIDENEDEAGTAIFRHNGRFYKESDDQFYKIYEFVDTVGDV